MGVYTNATDMGLSIWWARTHTASSHMEHTIRHPILTLSSVQSSQSVYPTLRDPMNWAYQASLSITNSQSSLKLMSIESVMPSSHLILCRPFSSCPQSLPASESFPMSQLCAWGGQSTGVSASASFLPKKSQGWSPSEWAGWISLQSKGLSRVFSNTTVQKHQFFGTQPVNVANYISLLMSKTYAMMKHSLLLVLC